MRFDGFDERGRMLARHFGDARDVSLHSRELHKAMELLCTGRVKVGIIGLGRMGEGMSRRMIKAGIEVMVIVTNYAKAEEQYEKGYISRIYHYS